MLLGIVAAVVLAVSVQTAQAKQLPVSSMTHHQLYKESQKEIAKGGIYSYAWGDASPYLKNLCYEMVRRAFTPYGTQSWARYVVNRESGCNPGAINKKWSSWNQQAKGIAQLIPAYHTWVNYDLMMRDLKYAVQVFVRLSKGGRNTGPWSCC